MARAPRRDRRECAQGRDLSTRVWVQAMLQLLEFRIFYHAQARMRTGLGPAGGRDAAALAPDAHGNYIFGVLRGYLAVVICRDGWRGKRREGFISARKRVFDTLFTTPARRKGVHATPRFQRIARTKVCALCNSDAERGPTSKAATHTLAAKKDQNSKIRGMCCSKQHCVSKGTGATLRRFLPVLVKSAPKNRGLAQPGCAETQGHRAEDINPSPICLPPPHAAKLRHR